MIIKKLEIISNNILKLVFNNWKIRYIDIYFFFDKKVKIKEVKKINYSIAVWDYDICPDLVYNYSFSDIDFLILKKELAYEIINKVKKDNLFTLFKPNLEIYIKEWIENTEKIRSILYN